MCKTKLLFLFTALLLSMSRVYAQENPWATQPGGSNPWAKETKEPDTTSIPRLKESGVPEGLETEEILIEETPAGKDTIIIIDKHVNESDREELELYAIERAARSEFNAVGTGVGAFLTSAFLNVFALPVNVLIGTLPSHKTQTLKKTFAEENPEATEEQRKAYRRGLRKEKASKAAIGTGAGIIANLLIIFSLSN